MAFDFPNSPTNGQNYEPVGGPKYQWNGYAWTKVAGGGGGGSAIAVSDTPPAGAADNSLWVESDTMGMYLRYHDTDGSQWTQLNGMADLASYVKKTGDTMSGDLTVTKENPILAVNKTASSGQAAYILGQTNGVLRWVINMATPAAESGANVGSDFTITGYSDAGGYLATPITINRATGVVTATGLPPKPQAAAGIGQYLAIQTAVGVGYTLPAGGTWVWWAHTVNNGTAGWSGNTTVSVSAGGTGILSVVAGHLWVGYAWRIA